MSRSWVQNETGRCHSTFLPDWTNSSMSSWKLHQKLPEKTENAARDSQRRINKICYQNWRTQGCEKQEENSVFHLNHRQKVAQERQHRHQKEQRSNYHQQKKARRQLDSKNHKLYVAHPRQRSLPIPRGEEIAFLRGGQQRACWQDERWKRVIANCTSSLNYAQNAA